MPKLYIIAGCNGSGKTTASYTLLPDLFNCWNFVNSDEFAKSLSPFDPSAASVSASRYMLLRIKYLLNKKEDFCIETTLATRSLLNIINEAREYSYSITLLYFWLDSPELAIRRVHNRVETGGHNIPDEVVRRRYKRGLEYLFHLYMQKVDRWIIADNSSPPFSVIAEGTKDQTIIKSAESYNRIQEIIHEK